MSNTTSCCCVLQRSSDATFLVAAHSHHERLAHFQHHLAGPLHNPDLNCDVVFVCGPKRREVAWNGLALLAAVSPVVRVAARSKEGRVTLLLPEFEPQSVRTLIRVAAVDGRANVDGEKELEELGKLMRAFGVREKRN